MINVNFEEALWHVYDCSRTLDNRAWDKDGVEIEVDENLVNAKLEELKVQEARTQEYPSIGDQLDMIFHAGLGGDEFQAAIQAVKDAHPKPE